MSEIRASIPKPTASKIAYISVMTGKPRRYLYGLLLGLLCDQLTQAELIGLMRGQVFLKISLIRTTPRDVTREEV